MQTENAFIFDPPKKTKSHGGPKRKLTNNFTIHNTLILANTITTPTGRRRSRLDNAVACLSTHNQSRSFIKYQIYRRSPFQVGSRIFKSRPRTRHLASFVQVSERTARCTLNNPSTLRVATLRTGVSSMKMHSPTKCARNEIIVALALCRPLMIINYH